MASIVRGLVMSWRNSGIGDYTKIKSSLDGVVVRRVEDFGLKFHYWDGASGQRYLHSIYSPIECPIFCASTYVLVHRQADGTRRALKVGRVSNEAPSLNLATVRHLSARVQANEIHLYSFGECEEKRLEVERDLQAGVMQAAH